MEADVDNYPSMYLMSHEAECVKATFPPYPLKEEIGGYARLNLVPTERANYIAEKVAKLPWRIVVVTDEDKQLVGNRIARELGPKCKVMDTVWIKPGKVAWDWWNNRNITGVNFRAGINTIDLSNFLDVRDLEHFKGQADIFADGINADREATDYQHTYQQVSANSLRF